MVVVLRWCGPKGGPGMVRFSLFQGEMIVDTCLPGGDVRTDGLVISLSVSMSSDYSTGALVGAGLSKSTALITDGRFSGASGKELIRAVWHS